MRVGSLPFFARLTVALAVVIVAVCVVLFVLKIALLALIAAGIVIGATYAVQFLRRLRSWARTNRSITTYRR